ncbi:MAG: hypothetical protein M9894_37815 [Planctomycetes bacterium]|nr:hypothetical protein [Planctomycetota bacterium]
MTPPVVGPEAPAPARPARRAPRRMLLRDRFAPPAWAGKRGPAAWLARGRAWLEASPGYAFAAFAHLLVVVLLSFVSVAVAVHDRVSRPVEVRLVAQSDVELVAPDDVPRALDDVAPPELDLHAEVATDDPFQEALGNAIGHLKDAASSGFGLAGGGGAGRGGDRDGVGGASRASDGALRAGLDWLSRHQSPDGGWTNLPPDHQATGRIGATGHPGVTALVLLCFLCAGEGPHEGPFADVVARGLAWLVRSVGVDGAMGRRFSGYEQSVGVLALAEAQARFPAPEVEQALRRAVACLEAAQDPVGGGWRYRPREKADTSVTCWAALGLKAAEHAGVQVGAGTWSGMKTLLEDVSREDGTTTYMAGVNRIGDGMVASGLFLRLMLGEPATTPRNAAAARLTAGIADRSRVDLYATYYAALAMYQVGGTEWREFNPKVRDAAVAAQTGGTHCERGSWAGGGVWLNHNVVLSTAFNVLTLETYYRYLPAGGQAPRPLLGRAPETVAERHLARAGELLAAAPERAAGVLLAVEAACDEALAALEAEPAGASLRERARAGKVLAAARAGDPVAVLARAAEYLAALPPGEAPDPGVLQARWAAAVERAGALAERAADAATPPAERERLVLELGALELLLRDDADRRAGRQRDAVLAATARLGELRRRLALRVAPDDAIAEARARLGPPEGPADADEVMLLHAVVAQALRALAGPGRGQPLVLEQAERDLAWVEARAAAGRVGPDERRRLVEGLRRAALQRLAALQALGRHRDVLAGVDRLRTAAPEEAAPAIDVLERSSLARLLELGEARPEEEGRLLDLVLGGPLAAADGDRAGAWLAVGERVLALGRHAEAGGCAARALETARSPEESARARLLRARAALAGGDAAAAEADVAALEREGLGDRVDVRLARCALLRARGEHDQALARYQEVVRALDGARPAPWWEAVEEIAHTYVEKGEPAQARRVLDELRRKDPTFGGDPARARRFVELMGRLDTMR